MLNIDNIPTVKILSEIATFVKERDVKESRAEFISAVLAKIQNFRQLISDELFEDLKTEYCEELTTKEYELEPLDATRVRVLSSIRSRQIVLINRPMEIESRVGGEVIRQFLYHRSVDVRNAIAVAIETGSDLNLIIGRYSPDSWEFDCVNLVGHIYRSKIESHGSGSKTLNCEGIITCQKLKVDLSFAVDPIGIGHYERRRGFVIAPPAIYALRMRCLQQSDCNEITDEFLFRSIPFVQPNCHPLTRKYISSTKTSWHIIDCFANGHYIHPIQTYVFFSSLIKRNGDVFADAYQMIEGKRVCFIDHVIDSCYHGNDRMCHAWNHGGFTQNVFLAQAIRSIALLFFFDFLPCMPHAEKMMNFRDFHIGGTRNWRLRSHSLQDLIDLVGTMKLTMCNMLRITTMADAIFPQIMAYSDNVKEYCIRWTFGDKYWDFLQSNLKNYEDAIERSMKREITPMPISSERVTVESGT